MVRKARHGLMQFWGYVLVTLAVAALSIGARVWSPHTSFDYVGPTTNAWQEPNGQYWVEEGENVNCWIQCLVDYDRWEEVGNPSNWGLALDTVNNITWAQTNGSWVEDNNNNNNNNSAGQGVSVTWRPDVTANEGSVRLAWLDDVASIPAGDVNNPPSSTRKDGPTAVNSATLQFKVFRIEGGNELWYFGENPWVNEQYALKGSYSVALQNAAGSYEWDVNGGLRIKRTTDPDESQYWTTSLSGTGLFTVDAKPVAKQNGTLTARYDVGDLEVERSVAVHYPNNHMPVADLANANERDPFVVAHVNAYVDKTGFNENKVQGHYYDVDAANFKEQALEPPGYASTGYFWLLDERDQPLQYSVGFYEYWWATNDVEWVPDYGFQGIGYTLWPGGDNWYTARPEGQTHPRAGTLGMPDGNHASIYWLKGQAFNWWKHSYPSPTNPSYPVNGDGEPVQYSYVRLGFGTSGEAGEPAYNFEVVWEDCTDRGRHYDY